MLSNSLSFVAVLLQYVHDLQQLSLQNWLKSDKSLLFLQTLVRSGDTETNLQSVQSGDTKAHLKSLCSGSVVFPDTGHLLNDCHLKDD